MKESNEMTNYGVVKDSSEKNRRKGMSQAKRLGKNFEGERTAAPKTLRWEEISLFQYLIEVA